MLIEDTLHISETNSILIISEERLSLTTCHQIYDFTSRFDCQIDLLIISDNLKAYQEALDEYSDLTNNRCEFKSDHHIINEIIEMLCTEIYMTDPDMILYSAIKNSFLNNIINDTNKLMTKLHSIRFVPL